MRRPFLRQLRLGVGYEFIERPDGYKGLAAKYGFKFAEAPRVMDLGLLYRALQNNQVDIVAGSNTDGLIAALDLVVLEDDRHYFPPYDAVPIVRRETLERHPEVAAALNRAEWTHQRRRYAAHELCRGWREEGCGGGGEGFPGAKLYLL